MPRQFTTYHVDGAGNTEEGITTADPYIAREYITAMRAECETHNRNHYHGAYDPEFPEAGDVDLDEIIADEEGAP